MYLNKRDSNAWPSGRSALDIACFRPFYTRAGSDGSNGFPVNFAADGERVKCKDWVKTHRCFADARNAAALAHAQGCCAQTENRMSGPAGVVADEVADASAMRADPPADESPAAIAGEAQSPSAEGPDEPDGCAEKMPAAAQWPEGGDAREESAAHELCEETPRPDPPGHCDARIVGLLYYQKWWYRREVDIAVNGELICGTPIFLREKTLRVVNNAFSYFIPMCNIDYIRTPDGLDMSYLEFE